MVSLSVSKSVLLQTSAMEYSGLICALVVVMAFVCRVNTLAAQQPQNQKSLCQAPADAPQRLEGVIEQCQEEIKQAVIEEALEALGESTSSLLTPSRNKRDTFSGEEKRIAGCLLQCVYRKVKAVDEYGMPTASGLVRLYSEGVQDRNYFIATLQAVQQCINLAHTRRAYNSPALQDGGYACDLAYDMFNCVSDKIEQICGRSP